MSKSREHRPAPQVASVTLVPPGTPHWITPALVEATLRVWQPYYATPLSVEDAVAILRGVDRLLRLMPSDRRP